MLRILPFLVLLLITEYIYPQDFSLTEESSFGGSNVENVMGVVQNANYYLWLVNSNSPASENKTVPNYGFNDYWVICTDLDYNMQWQKGYGGSSSDDILDVLIDNDGNYYLIGNSDSNISGNKVVDSYGSYDYWVIKLDSFGNEIWQKSYGGDQYDSFNSSLLLSNGNIILAGTSQSGISGIKTEANRGNFDVWLVCVNTDGEVIWDKTLGGEEFDFGVRLLSSTSDNVFLLSNSSSGIGYEKTEACIGGNDIWLTEINSESGSVIWDKTIGSNNNDNPVDFLLTEENFYILTSSFGDISGDKTEDCRGGDDYWLVKVDLLGNVILDKTIGGNNVDLATCISFTDTTGIIIGGSSKSDAGFEKSEDAYDTSNFNEDYWIVCLNNDFDIVWDKTIGGDSRDLLSGCFPVSSTKLMFYGSSSSGISFDRNVPLVGESDVWFAEMQIPPFSSSVIHYNVENKLVCYPNPTCDFLYLNNRGVSYVNLVDFSGKIVFEARNNFQQLNLEKLPAGVYLINAIIDDETFKSKIVVF